MVDREVDLLEVGMTRQGAVIVPAEHIFELAEVTVK